jgi:hypothetical protein
VPCQTFKVDGSVVMNEVSKAHNEGFTVDNYVRITETKHDVTENTVGVVRAVTPSGIRVVFGTHELVVKAAKLQKLTSDEKKAHVDELTQAKAAAEAAHKARIDADKNMVLPNGATFVLASQGQTKSALRCWVELTLWKVVVSCSHGAGSLRLVLAEGTAPKQLIAGESIKANTLCLIPFGKVSESKPTDGVSEEIQVSFDLPGGTSNKASFWVSSFYQIGGDPLASPPTPPSMSPYWFVRNIAPQPDSIKLTSVVHKFDSPTQAMCSFPKSVEQCKVVKKAATALRLIVQVGVLTNPVDVPKGAQLCM